MFLFLTVLQGIIAAALVGIILMQKSEGGGLGMGGGGNPSSIFSARGAGDFLTRTTAILAILFVILSIVLAAVAVDVSTGGEIDTSLNRQVAPAAPAAGAQPTGIPVDAAPAPAQSAPAPKSNDPLSGLAD
ncbi:MAG TPA: preprotein translocase subunit SecG [Croceibacterium sp.]|nr:preprotein translocase subunit SecG [Croceibacterium sp.]